MNKINALLRRIFVPQYDELALFLMSSASILVVVTHESLRAGAFRMIFSWEFYSLLVVVLFGLGIAFSLYHAFVSREKTYREKKFMLFSAVMINGVGGVVAGEHVIGEATSLLTLIFPLWNIANGFLLLLMYRFDIIDEGIIVDDDAAPYEVVIGLSVVLMTFAISTFVFDLHPAVVFSMCVAYATNINALVKDIVSASVR
jgi:hypothetical protein